MNSIQKSLANLSLGKQLFASNKPVAIASFERFYKSQKHEIPTPKPGAGKQFRRYVIILLEVMLHSSEFLAILKYSSLRLVHYPEDKKYTIKPLNVTHLAGRDPVTGRVVRMLFCSRSIEIQRNRHSLPFL